MIARRFRTAECIRHPQPRSTGGRMPGSQDGQANDADRFFVRRPGGNVIGPFDKDAIRLMVQADKISEDAELSPDKESWKPLSEHDDLTAGTGGTQDAGRPSVNLPASATGDDADLPTPADDPFDEPAADETPAGDDADLPTPADASNDTDRHKDRDDGSDDKPNLSSLRNRLDLPKSKQSSTRDTSSTSDDASTSGETTGESDAESSGGIGLPTPAEAGASQSDDDEASPEDDRTPEDDLPTSKRSGTDLPKSKDSAPSSSSGGPPDLPTPKEKSTADSQPDDPSDLPAASEPSNLPVDAEDNLPADAEDNLPADAEDNLPADAEDNLPTDAQSDLPRDAEDNLPRDAQDNLPGDADEGLFDAPASGDDDLFEPEDDETSSDQPGAEQSDEPDANEPDPFDDEDDLFSEPSAPAIGTPDGEADDNESRALELGRDIGAPDGGGADGDPADTETADTEQSPAPSPSPSERTDADEPETKQGLGGGESPPVDPNADTRRENDRDEPIRLDDDPEPFGDISDDDLSPVEDDQSTDDSPPQDEPAGDGPILDDEEQALFDSDEPEPSDAADRSSERSPDSPSAEAEDDPLRVEAPTSGADAPGDPETSDEAYDEGEFITEPAGGDMQAGQADPDPEEDDFAYGEVDFGQDADDSLELDAPADEAPDRGSTGGVSPEPADTPDRQPTGDPQPTSGSVEPSPAETESAGPPADRQKSRQQQDRTEPTPDQQTTPSDDTDSSNSIGGILSIIAMALVAAGGWYGYSTWFNDGTTDSDASQKQAAANTPSNNIDLSLDAVGPDTYGAFRSVLDQTNSGKVEGDDRGTLLLAQALLLSRYEDPNVRKAGEQLASSLSDATDGQLAVGRGAWSASRGHAESATGYLEPLFDADDDTIAYFAHLSAGIGEILAANSSEQPGDENSPAETNTGETVDGSTDEADQHDAGDVGPQAAPPDTTTEESLSVESTESDSTTPPTADAGQTPPEASEQRPVRASESRADRASNHLVQAADLKQTWAAPFYWRGRLAELRRDDKQAIAHYRKGLERQNDHVASHLRLGTALYEDGQLEAASRHVGTILSELGAQAAAAETADAYHLEGDIALARSQTPDAIESFKKALNISTDRPETIRTLIDTYERAGEHKSALTFFSNPKTFDQKNAEILLARARAHIGLEEWSNAIDVLETGETEYPDDARFSFQLGELYMAKANSREARRAMRRAVKLDPTLLEARAALAHLAWLTDQDARIADEHVSQILEYPDAIDASVATRVAEYYTSRGVTNRAREWLEEGLNRNPNHWPARLQLAQLYLDREQTDRALDILEEAKQEGVDNIQLSAHLADAYRQSEQYDRALQAINQVLDREPNHAKWHLIRGRIHFDRGNWETAMSNFNRARELDPQMYRATFYIGRTQYANDDYEAALETFRGILDYRSDEGEYQDWMARTLHRLGRHQKARTHYERAIEVDPRYADRHADLYVRFSDLLVSLGYLEQANQQVDRALQIDPESLSARLARADILFEKEDYDEAADMYQKVLEKDDSRAQAHYKLGMCHLYENERNKAARALQKAIRHGYDNPDIYEKLGYIYKELGQNQEAVDAFEAFLKQSDPSSLATETRREILNQIERLGG